MPLPTPKDGESRQEFLDRCIPAVKGEDEYDDDQAVAICYSQWRKEHGGSKPSDRIRERLTRSKAHG